MIAGEDASMTGLSHRETYGTPMPATSYPFMGRSGDPFMPPFGDPPTGGGGGPRPGGLTGGGGAGVSPPIFLGAKP